MNNPVRYGIIGIGNMGREHANSLLNGDVPGATLTGVYDITPSQATHLAEKGVTIFDSAAAMFKSGTVDAIVVATPHYFHPDLAMEAFAHGLHVLIEKPAGVYTKQVREMNEAAAKSGREFGIMFQQRTHSHFQKMRELVHSGQLGQIKRTNWLITNWYRPQAYYDSGGWRATWRGEGGGVLLNQCPHNLDIWQWVCGMPHKVTAFCHEGKWHNIEVEDDVTAYVEYPNGATGVFITSTADAPGTNRFEIVGDKGKLVYENGQLLFHKLATPEREFNRTNTEPFGSPASEKRDITENVPFPSHPGIFRNFTDKILGTTPILIAPGEDGIHGLTLSNAMHLSGWLGKTVELPLDEDLFLSMLRKKCR